MKKLVALVLALALCLSLCSVTAFAGETIEELNVTYNGLDYKNPENLVLNSNNVNVRAGFQLQLFDDDRPVFYYDSYSGSWGSVEEDGPIEKNRVNFKEVNRVLWYLVLNTDDDTFKSDGFILTVNGETFEDGYFIDDDYYDQLEIYIWQDISGDDDDGCKLDCKTLAKVGMAAVGVVTAVVVTKVVVDKLHAIKAACDAAAVVVTKFVVDKLYAINTTESIKAGEMPAVSIGSSGDAVTTLQTKLNAQGYDCGEEDGIFGQNTLNAVIAFQTAKGLTADGIVGELTWGALL